MVAILNDGEHLRRIFAALTEQTFHVELGIADPKLVDYISRLLMKFVRYDELIKFRNSVGNRLEEVADMLVEAEEREACPRRELYRHIGDFTLFWTGVYPESVKTKTAVGKKDHLIDYCEQGKRSYYIASTFKQEPFEEEAVVLRRLSREFDLCSLGLNRVRKEWEKLSAVDS